MLRIVNFMMLLAFVTYAILQYNDPDSWIWMIVYGLAATFSLLYHFKKLNWMFSSFLSLIALVWAGTLAQKVVGNVAFLDLFTEIQMKDTTVELAREMGGLIIIAVWMTVLAFVQYRSQLYHKEASV